MIRNRIDSGGTPSGSRSDSRDENGDIQAISDDVINKEKHQARCFNQLQRHRARRSATMVAGLLFFLFNVQRMVLFSAVHQVNSPDLSLEEFHRPKNSTKKHAVPKSGTTDQYKVRKTIHSLPTNPRDYSTIEKMVQSHFGNDERWYDACKNDNATQWKKFMWEKGGDPGKYFARACPNTGLHPDGVHWNPFRTKYHNCSVTSRINLEIKRDHFWEDWRIQTLDAHGIPKTLGGDTFYIVYSEYIDTKDAPNLDIGNQSLLPMAVAIPIDYYNGTYGLDFVSVPFLDNTLTVPPKHDGQEKKGTLSIHAITTCFIGDLHPPLKDGWKTGGQTNVTWTIENVSRPYRIQNWYTDHYQPKQYWESIDPKKKVQNSLSEFDRIVFVGDSILTHMLWDFNRQEYHPIASEMVKSGSIWEGPTRANGSPIILHIPLSQSTLQTYLAAIDPWIRGGLSDNQIETNTTKQNSSTKTVKKKALVLGSAAWDIIWPADWQGPHFKNHLSTVETLLTLLRKAHPEVTLVWKLPYAQHMQEAQKNCFTAPGSASDGGSCVQALRYASRERFEKLYHKQKSFIEEKFAGDDKVRLLDFYEVSYLSGSHWMLPGDSIHYSPEFHAAVLRLLFT